MSLGYSALWKEKTAYCLGENPDVSVLSQSLDATVPQQHWVTKILPGLGYGTALLVELPVIALSACQRLAISYQALDQAQEQFRWGFYDEAANKCRIALEPLFEPVDKPDGTGKMQALKKSWETNRWGQTVERNILLL